MTAHIFSDFVSMVQKAHAPKFTRQLSFDEQRALPTEHIEAYWDWLFSQPIKTRVDLSRYLDRDYRVVGSIHDYEWSE